jgi:hypothetical protein
MAQEQSYSDLLFSSVASVPAVTRLPSLSDFSLGAAQDTESLLRDCESAAAEPRSLDPQALRRLHSLLKTTHGGKSALGRSHSPQFEERFSALNVAVSKLELDRQGKGKTQEVHWRESGRVGRTSCDLSRVGHAEPSPEFGRLSSSAPSNLRLPNSYLPLAARAAAEQGCRRDDTLLRPRHDDEDARAGYSLLASTSE